MRNLDSQHGAFQNDNALMYHFIYKLFTDTDSYGPCETEKEYIGLSSCVLTSLRDFLALASVSVRPQMQKGNCKAHTMVMRAKWRFAACVPHSKEKQTDKVALTKALKLTTLLKKLEVHSLRQWSKCMGPTREVWQRFWHDSVLSWSHGHKEGLWGKICPKLFWLEVGQWCLKWQPSWGRWSVSNTPGHSGILYPEKVDTGKKTAWKAKHQAHHEAHYLVHKLWLLLLRHSSRFTLNLQRVMKS